VLRKGYIRCSKSPQIAPVFFIGKKDGKKRMVQDYLYEVVIDGPEVDIVEKIKKARSKDEEVVRVVEEIKKAEVKMLQEEKWQIEGELVLKEGKVYVLKNEELRVEIIQLHHDVLVAGHREKWKMMELVIRNYWWPGVTKDVGKYIEECDMC